MTKRDFELIARTLRELAPDRAQGRAINRAQWTDTVHAMASALSESHPRFDRARFLSACGLTAEQPIASAQPTASVRCPECRHHGAHRLDCSRRRAKGER
jgi:hypothetical protein